jgi:hypothetical protein
VAMAQARVQDLLGLRRSKGGGPAGSGVAAAAAAAAAAAEAEEGGEAAAEEAAYGDARLEDGGAGRGARDDADRGRELLKQLESCAHDRAGELDSAGLLESMGLALASLSSWQRDQEESMRANREARLRELDSPGSLFVPEQAASAFREAWVEMATARCDEAAVSLRARGAAATAQAERPASARASAVVERALASCSDPAQATAESLRSELAKLRVDQRLAEARDAALANGCGEAELLESLSHEFNSIYDIGAQLDSFNSDLARLLAAE